MRWRIGSFRHLISFHRQQRKVCFEFPLLNPSPCCSWRVFDRRWLEPSRLLYWTGPPFFCLFRPVYLETSDSHFLMSKSGPWPNVVIVKGELQEPSISRLYREIDEENKKKEFSSSPSVTFTIRNHRPRHLAARNPQNQDSRVHNLESLEFAVQRKKI